jgi:hypothetical protein
MTDITIKRFSHTSQATYGVFLKNGNVPFILSLELPWLNNQPRVSCIPAGRYLCKPYSSAKFPKGFSVESVTGRSAILIHPANVAQRDLLGCIATGTSFDDFGAVGGVGGSVAALNELIAVTGNKEFWLNIV